MKHLDALTARAQEAAKAVQTALQFDTVESRRKRVLDYGRTLLAIRKEIAADQAFYQHLRKNGLEVHDRSFRADAMWLAENWNGVGPVLHQCPCANPSRIRKWYRSSQGAEAVAKVKA